MWRTAGESRRTAARPAVRCPAVPVDRPAGASPAGRSAPWLLFGVTGILSAGNSVVFPLLADLQAAHGLPTWGLGILSAASFLSALAGQLVLAPLADRGRERLLLLGGLGLTVVALVGLAAGSELWHFVAARGVEGLALGSFLPAARSVVIRASSGEVGRNLGRLSAGEFTGFTLGPVVGAALASWGTLATPFLALAGAVAAATAAFAVRPTWFVGPVRRQGSQRRRVGAPPGATLALLRRRAVVVAALLVLALTLPIGVYDALWAPYLSERGASTFFIGLSFTLYGIPYVALASTGGRLADRFGPVPVAFTAVVVLAPILALYGLLARPGLILLVSMVEGTVQAAAVPAMQLAMAQATPPDRLAAGQGLAGAVQYAGAAVAAALAAPLYGLSGPVALFATTAVVTLVVGLVAWGLRPERDRSRTLAP